MFIGYLPAETLTWTIFEPDQPFAIVKNSPGLILNYDQSVEGQLTEKIIPFVKEENVFVNIADNGDGTCEISVFIIVSCVPPIELNLQNRKVFMVDGEDPTSQVISRRKKLFKQGIATADMVIAGTGTDFPTPDIKNFLRSRDRVGHIVFAVGIVAPGGSLLYREWFVATRQLSFLPSEEFCSKLGVKIWKW